MTVYLLWDIDGTLVSTGRAGVFALEEAAREVLGIQVDLQQMTTAGLTDAGIATAVLQAHRETIAHGDVGRFLGAYERALPERLGWRRGRVLEGVRETLDALAHRPDVENLLLTGNVRGGARAKLSHYGLDGYFDDGAFCVDDTDRDDIARRALALLTEREGGRAPPGERVVVIGDTPHDVACGNTIGARTLAVASGSYSLAELAACDPWQAVERLPEPERLFELLGLPADAPT